MPTKRPADPAVVREINRTRARMGVEPLLAFGWGKLSPDFLREKAEKQRRKLGGKGGGQFIEERGIKARLDDDVDAPQSGGGGGGTYDAGVKLLPAAPDAPPRAGFKERWEAVQADLPKPEDFGRSEMKPDAIPHFFVAKRDLMREALAEAEAAGFKPGAMSDDLKSMVRDQMGVSPNADPVKMAAQMRSRVRAEEAESAKKAQAWVDYWKDKPVPDRAPHDPSGQMMPGDKPGEVGKAHLEAMKAAGKVLDEELESRIQARRVSDPDTEALAKARDTLVKNIEDLEKATAEARKIEADTAKKALKDYNKNREGGKRFWSVKGVYEGLGSNDPARKKQAEEAMAHMQRAVAADEAAGAKRAEVDERKTMVTQLHATLKEASEGMLVPGTRAYAKAQREETLKLLAEIRPMGHDPDKHYEVGIGDIVAEDEEDITDAVLKAMDSYPTDWGDHLTKALDGDGIVVTSAERGFFGWKKRQLSVSPGEEMIDGENGYLSVAVHELGHGMERAVPGVKIMQWLMSHDRSPRDEENPNPIFSLNEWGYRDQWAHIYNGKVYDDSPDANWELLTQGIEALLAGEPWFFRSEADGGFDREYRALILAMLAHL